MFCIVLQLACTSVWQYQSPARELPRRDSPKVLVLNQPSHPPGQANLQPYFKYQVLIFLASGPPFHFDPLQRQGFKPVCSCLSPNPSPRGFNSICCLIYGCFCSICFCESPKMLPIMSLGSFLLFSRNKMSYNIDRYLACP